ncbi:phosphatase [Lithospermum erythrorhizon]|uniref:Phosphatase n=1 Tax=Lithospermum erythrorhizon TaxID=34254 RepID=A0AAV3NV06_LITER
MIMDLVSRTGRDLQRYNKGRRLVVGCIPYKYKDGERGTLIEEELEVMVISTQRGHGKLFPKGGWELDESAEEAASRETIEEAGVLGNMEPELGRWRFKSKGGGGIHHEAYMFPLLVTEQLESWPEMDIRQREWMNVTEARQICKHWWMKEALDRLVERLKSSSAGNQTGEDDDASELQETVEP